MSHAFLYTYDFDRCGEDFLCLRASLARWSLGISKHAQLEEPKNLSIVSKNEKKICRFRDQAAIMMVEVQK